MKRSENYIDWLKSVDLQLSDAIYKSYPLDIDPKRLAEWGIHFGHLQLNGETIYTYAKRLREAVKNAINYRANGLERARMLAHDYRKNQHSARQEA